MPLLRIPQPLVDDIVNVANMAKDVNVPQEVVQNGIIMSAARLSNLDERPDTTAALAALREEYDAQQGVIDDLRARLDEARATQNALTTALAAAGNAAANAATANATAAPHRGHLRIPDPEKYKGDREKLRPFITQLRLKAALYPDCHDS